MASASWILSSAFAFALASAFASAAAWASAITSLASSSNLTIAAVFTPVTVLDLNCCMGGFRAIFGALGGTMAESLGM